MKKVLFVFGTRPEAIKCAPLIKEFQKSRSFVTRVAVTAQHREMLDQVLDFFKVQPDFDLNLMKPGQDLFDVTSDSLKGLRNILESEKPDLVFVQGDTTSVFTGALASFYMRIPVAHLEAGLRSHKKYSPFPEEINRLMTGHLSTWHFAPTEGTRKNLLDEGINDNIHVVGNTVIDALHLALGTIENSEKLKQDIVCFFKNIIGHDISLSSQKNILITGHRRESFGQPFLNICSSIKQLSQNYPDVNFIYPVHLNPNVQKPVYEILSKCNNVYLIEPLTYPKLVWLMNMSYLVLTDSGGIQEEAPSLGKPVLVMRDVTERTEGIEAGTAKLVGTDMEDIISSLSLLINDKGKYMEMAKAVNPYGNGNTSKRIVEILEKEL